MSRAALSPPERGLVERALAGATGPVLLSMTEEVAAGDPLDFFANALRTGDAAYWEQPSRGLAMAACGRAWEFAAQGPRRFRLAREALQAIRARAVSTGGPGPVMLGGFAFADSVTAPHWAAFGAGRIWAPELLLRVEGGRTTLSRTLLVDEDAGVDAWARLAACAADLIATAPSGGATPSSEPLGGGDGGWTLRVADAVRQIRAGAASKAVLARELRLRASDPPNAAAALRNLRRDYPRCTLFAFQRGEACFLGASPETLVEARGGRCTTAAIAGSARRGADPADDAEIARAFLHDAKERGEHELVVQAMREALAPVCAGLRAPACPEILKMPNVQHLCTPFEGDLAEGVTVLDLVERLHPTPSVGGWPREAALGLIERYEGFDRGWYAGPAGWFDPDGNGEFVVAIRSALVSGREARLFAGCGIVAASEPSREYAESQLKLRPMLCALNVR